jgi:hypothetical protein
MSQQRLKEWKPLEGIPARLYLEALHDDYEGLRFLLRGEDPAEAMLRLSFGLVIGYRSINESYRIRTWAVGLMKGMPSLLTIENSEWVKWLVDEAGGVLRKDSLVHYAIYTPEDCIDVVSQTPPIVEWL